MKVSAIAAVSFSFLAALVEVTGKNVDVIEDGHTMMLRTPTVGLQEKSKGMQGQQADERSLQHTNNSTIPPLEHRAVNKDLGFLFRLWHEDGIKWEERGKDWCMMCQGKDGCTYDDPLVTNHCNPNDPDQRWEYIKVKDGVGQIKARRQNLCMARLGKLEYRLKRCNKRDERQHFIGFDYNNRFKLRPLNKQKNCFTMLHHPTSKKEHDGEEFREQPCHKPERTETVYYVADYRGKVKEKLGYKNYKCSKKKKCGECQGDCNNDSDCKGDLRCWQRYEKGWRVGRDNGWKEPWSLVPGCGGMGVFGRDYCYDPKKRE